MWKKTCLLLGALLLVAGSAAADQIMFGATLNATPGEPDFEESRPSLFAAYEAQALWRFSFTTSEYEHETNSNVKLNARIVGFERMFVYQMGQNVLLIGGFGPGYFTAEVDTPGGTESGNAVGLLASGELRFYFGQGFFDAGFHYRNAAVEVNDSTVNGGYQGFFAAGGFKF